MNLSERDIQIAYLTPNPYSRPRRPLRSVKGLVIHWTENPGASALFNRNFYELRQHGKHGYGSAHYIIGLGGEIVQDIPLTEMAYHVGAHTYTPYAREKFGSYPNNCTIGIELCHLDWEGRQAPATLISALDLCAGLCEHYDLEPLDDITTHYAITLKVTPRGPCPKWFTEHPEEFEAFKQDVDRLLIGRLT